MAATIDMDVVLASVRRWTGDSIDDEHANRATGGLELQPELFLERRKDRRPTARFACGSVDGRSRRWRRCPFHVEIESPLEPSPIEDLALDAPHARKVTGKLRHRGAAAADRPEPHADCAWHGWMALEIQHCS